MGLEGEKYSISGKYEIYWNWIDARFYLKITISIGCEAGIILPNEISYNVKAVKFNYECHINKKYIVLLISIPLNEI